MVPTHPPLLLSFPYFLSQFFFLFYYCSLPNKQYILNYFSYHGLVDLFVLLSGISGTVIEVFSALCCCYDFFSVLGPARFPFPKVVLASCEVCLFLAYLLLSHQWNPTMALLLLLLDSHKSISSHPGVSLVQ